MGFLSSHPAAVNVKPKPRRRPALGRLLPPQKLLLCSLRAGVSTPGGDAQIGGEVQFYRVSGLSVASEIVLPGAIASIADGGAQVSIRRGPVPENLANPRSSGATWQIAGKQFLLRIPEIVRFLLTEGREIVFAPETEAGAADVAIFILGTVFGILLHQREQVVLHASAVRVNGRAVLFCGSSGAGKSTIAAALAQRGYPLVTDDVCAVTVTDAGASTVNPDGRQLKLWAQAIERLDLAARRGERVRASLEKFYVDPGEVFSEPLMLGAVYALREARPPHAPGIEKPNVVDSALILRRSAYRPLLVRRLDQKTNYFHAAAAIANTAGIFHLTRALDFAKMGEVIGWLERHWLDLKLTEQAA